MLIVSDISPHCIVSRPFTHKMGITPEQIAIVKATAPVLKERGNDITKVFYKNMFAANPSLKEIFNLSHQATGRQPRALAKAVLAYATYIDNLPALSAAVEHIAHKHASLAVQPAQYDIVGKHLLEAIGIVLGDAATPAIVDAWAAAYGQLAQVFINREGQLYKANQGWEGWRRFTVKRRIEESATITSFYLSPVDGLPLPPFLPGQYVSLQIMVPQLGHKQSRQYSLSDAPQANGEYYRISVKKEAGAESGMPGKVSTLLHEKYHPGSEVELTHPQGDFFCDVTPEKANGTSPVVLISAGVGATPLMSIFNALTQNPSNRPIRWIHASHSRAVQPFADHVRQVTLKNPNVGTHIFLSEMDKSAPTDDCSYMARLELDRLDAKEDLFVHDPSAAFYLCGPEDFMTQVQDSLQANGVLPSQIHQELFSVVA